MVPLQQQGLFCPTEAEALSPQPVNLTDLNPELIDLLCHRLETALQLGHLANPFLPEVEELFTFLDPAANGDLISVVRNDMAQFSLMFLPPLRPSAKHHAEGGSNEHGSQTEHEHRRA